MASLKIEDNLKNKDDLKNEDDLKNKDDLKNEERKYQNFCIGTPFVKINFKMQFFVPGYDNRNLLR